ncbi:hypothetical protein SAMN05880501_1118 [Ureibacillus xyleni]|uniref:Uncharacterized protein n=1 Tax=Ureibacillus xyleni TaxID=614648 RepID=A0A285TC51_9BACL|nr:hypothetical protein [Ureibacillus xyleni]SOC19500.1 hypothetical protein SAMN05880501_1118 [Ureibacillus xyleni]
MNRTQFLLKLKGILESEQGCTTKTTPKKGEGFVPYNRFNIKWGQVDADDSKNHIRLVFDLKPGSLYEEMFSQKTGLIITPPGKISTGYRFTKVKEQGGHDQLIIFLEDSFISSQPEQLAEILTFVKEFVGQSSFKSQASR